MSCMFPTYAESDTYVYIVYCGDKVIIALNKHLVSSIRRNVKKKDNRNIKSIWYKKR